jgi:hypothetical protein
MLKTPGGGFAHLRKNVERPLSPAMRWSQVPPKQHRRKNKPRHRWEDVCRGQRRRLRFAVGAATVQLGGREELPSAAATHCNTYVDLESPATH